jgi:hypothetical protein
VIGTGAETLMARLESGPLRTGASDPMSLSILLTSLGMSEDPVLAQAAGPFVDEIHDTSRTMNEGHPNLGAQFRRLDEARRLERHGLDG